MDSNDLNPVTDAELQQQLADRVQYHAAQARSARIHRLRVAHAVECGQTLLRLKELVGRGHWAGWVQQRCGLSRMTANRYMRLAGQTDKLAPMMSIRGAYLAAGIIRKPRPEPDPETPA